MRSSICHNGIITENPESLVNRAFLFGDGFFESFRMRRGQVMFWEQHKERMIQASSVLHISMNEDVLHSIHQGILDLYNSYGEKFPCRGRVTVFRKGAGLYTPETNDAAFVIQLFELEREDYQLNRQGLLVDIFNGMQKPVNILSSFKTLNALPFVLAGIEKKERHLDEVLILNTSNRLCETSTSNLFCVKGDVVLTPGLNEGCVNGVMRKVILEHGSSFGVQVKETSLTTLDLYECDELFISNAARGIQWIMGFRNKRYFNKVSGQLVKMLNELVQ